MKALKRERYFSRAAWGSDRATHPGFEVFEDFWILEWKFQLVTIENLEDDHFVAMKTELFESECDVFGWLEEIRKEQDDAATMNEAYRVLQQVGKARAAGGLKEFKFAQNEAELIWALRRADEVRSRGGGFVAAVRRLYISLLGSAAGINWSLLTSAATT